MRKLNIKEDIHEDEIEIKKEIEDEEIKKAKKITIDKKTIKNILPV